VLHLKFESNLYKADKTKIRHLKKDLRRKGKALVEAAALLVLR